MSCPARPGNVKPASRARIKERLNVAFKNKKHKTLFAFGLAALAVFMYLAILTKTAYF